MLNYLKGYTCSLGVFPVSIKNEDFLSIARCSDVQAKAEKIREEVSSQFFLQLINNQYIFLKSNFIF